VYNEIVATLLPTKFYVPPAPASFVARPRLAGLLAEALCRHLTLVSAPPGTGKTTLMSAWAQSVRKKGIAIGWLSLDEADNEPRTFLEYLLACVEEAGVAIDHIDAPPGAGYPDEMQSLLGDVIRSIVPLKREVVLILDDYHVIQNMAVHAAVGYLLGHTPPQLHLVILTRTDPPLELARFRVSEQLVEVRMEQLRFSSREAGEFLHKVADVQLAEADVAALNDRAEGWAAGLQMAAISMRGRTDQPGFVSAFAGSHRFVFDYLLEQVLDRQTPAVREFLLKTSVLERFSASLCDAVAETGGAARSMLDALERANLFLIPLDDERGWYRYHHLLSDLLKLILEQEHPGLSKELHHRASHWFEAQGLLSESLQHALVAGDMELVAHIVSGNVLFLVENDEAAKLLRQIEAVPIPEMISRPWMGLARAWALGAAQVQKSKEILDAVEACVAEIAERDEAQRLRGHIAAARAYIFSLEGDRDHTIAQAQLAEDLLPADEIAVRAMNLTIWGDIRTDDRKHDPSALPMLERALTLAQQAGKPHVAMTAAAAIASANLHLGRFHEMERICREALSIEDAYEQRYQRPLSATANVYALLARVMTEWGENEHAVELARKGLLLSERWGQVDAQVTCLSYLGRALALAKDWEQARLVCQRADKLAESISPWSYQSTFVFNLSSLLDSDLPKAREIAETRCLVERSGVAHTELLRARLWLRDGHPDEALEAVEEHYSRMKGRPSFDHPWIEGLRALAYQAKGDEKRALASLHAALELGEPENRIATFLREGAPMEALLRVARAKTLNPRFIDRLLAAFEAQRGHEPRATPVMEGLVEPLSERELEVLQHLDGPLSTPEIAETLVVSANTVRTHIKSIYGKLGAHGRSAAVRRARELSILA
jgi:ATP/maltotriose-dependent transcriptional regulator MalT